MDFSPMLRLIALYIVRVCVGGTFHSEEKVSISLSFRQLKKHSSYNLLEMSGIVSERGFIINIPEFVEIISIHFYSY